MQKPYDHGFSEYHISPFRQQTHSVLNVLIVREIDFFGKEEALLHADAEISDPLDLLSLGAIADGELGQPHTVDKLLHVLNDVVEDEIQKDEEFDSHEFVVFPIDQKHLHLRHVRIQHVDALLGVD